jgi:UDP-N-acetyl-D-glucosamine dehydrogenase
MNRPTEPSPASSPAADALVAKIQNRSAVIGVIGLGYVGLPLLSTFNLAGFRTIGLDNDPGKIRDLAAGTNYLKHLGQDLVKNLIASNRFQPTTDLARLADADAIVICVPTPLGKHLDPDLSYVQKAADACAATLKPGQLIVLESTTYPGTTRDIMLPRLAAKGLTVGRDFFLAFSPEREDPGRTDWTTATIPKLVGGVDPVSGKVAVALYESAVKKVIPVRSAEIAEAAKILENVYRSVNIALVNEMKVLLSVLGIDVWEVIAAATTKPFGFQPFYPGPGLGGHCIPIDPYYLTYKAREVGLPTRFIELAGEINHDMPRYVVNKTMLALNDRRRSVKGSRILILGLAYKPDVDDVRESPSFELIDQLTDLGATVDYNDPHVPATHPMRKYGDLGLRSVPLTPESLAAYDCIVIATRHTAYDWQQIADHAKLIVDTRNAMANVAGRRDHITMA